MGLRTHGKVCPRRNSNNSRRHSSSLVAKLLTEGIAKPCPGALSRKDNSRGLVSAGKQITVGIHGVVKSRRIGMLGSKAILGSKDADTKLRGYHRCTAADIVETSAGVSATVKIEYYSSAKLVARNGKDGTHTILLSFVLYDLISMGEAYKRACGILGLASRRKRNIICNAAHSLDLSADKAVLKLHSAYLLSANI
jgi:hypothetical protein